jgi:Protein of unknown function (DUF2490)
MQPARRVSVLVFLLCSLAASDVHAQARESQLWTSVLVTAKVSGDQSGFSAWLDLHDRRGKGNTTVLVRPGVGYRLSKTTSVWLGYAWIGAYPDEPAKRTIEHRVWQQFIYQDSFGQLTPQLRLRLEQRHRADASLALRARALVRLNATLWPKGPLAVAGWDEVFVALGRTAWGAPGGFDQNRLFLGLAYTSGPLRVEAGYMGVSTRRADESLLHSHNPTLWAFFSF